jgi:hypothetical protein
VTGFAVIVSAWFDIDTWLLLIRAAPLWSDPQLLENDE